MKIIFSRKGYDLQYGRYPSIILPAGEMLSFPIPLPNERGIESSLLYFRDKNLQEIFTELGHKEVNINHHLDPDLGIYTINKKASKSVGIFGQAEAASGHLLNQKIDKGDIFLFFGTFRHTIIENNKLCYDKQSKPFHAIYGYLIIDEIIKDIESIPANVKYIRAIEHPHYLNREHPSFKSNNLVFLSNQYGFFNYNPILKLTKPDANKSLWSLPSFFKDLQISYHKKGGYIEGDSYILQTVAKGQEFVTEINQSTEVQEWLNNIKLCHQI